MNPHVATRLFDELFIAAVAYYLAGRPLSESLRQQAHHHRGETQRMLRHFSMLPDLPSKIATFIQEMQA